ncbi:hypothetical protein [Neobacillus mesonae]|uniref:hypothetical protein n=1 Tax=Neobacillus mesonae TaxID=1193713 RepID=UPI00203A9E87|nr:hypothetical protein [Neobacillus mesonae]MCM3567288.1 hypothetical protein [Neobacillus mesonae]
MALIKVHTDYVRSTGNILGTKIARVEDVKGDISSLRHGIDRKILSRRNIDLKLSSSLNELNKIVMHMRELDRFIDQSMDRYQRTEQGLVKKSGEIKASKGSKKQEESSIMNDILGVIDKVDSALGDGDNVLLASQVFSLLAASGYTRKLNIRYINGKPTFLQKIKGDYKFTVRADASWTRRGNYSSKVARAIYNFSKSNPTNPIVKQLHKLVTSYTSPSAMLKHAAGFPKNVNGMMKANTLAGTFHGRITAGTKEVAEAVLDGKGWTKAARKIPLAGTLISIGANAGEIWDPANANKTFAEKTGRAAAGFTSDLVAISGGVKVGAMIGSIGGPAGIIIGGAVGGVVGAVASTVFEDQIKEVGEKAGALVDSGIKAASSGIGKAFKSVGSWFK